MAATTGTGNAAICASVLCPFLASVSASLALVQAAIMVMSAPAINESGLPETITSPSSAVCCCARISTSFTCSTNSALSVFTLSPGTSMVITPMLSGRIVS